LPTACADTPPPPYDPCDHHPPQANNAVVREWGEKREGEGLRSHYDLVQMLDIVNMEAGTAVSGCARCAGWLWWLVAGGD